MRSLLLLFFAFVSLSLFPQNVYIIRDGYMHAAVSYNQYEDEGGLSSPEIILHDGYLEFVPQRSGGNIRLDIDQKRLDFSPLHRRLVLEYQLPESAMTVDAETASANWQAQTAADYCAPTLVVSTSAARGDSAKADCWDENTISYSCIDGKFNPAASSGYVTYKGDLFLKNNDDVATIFIRYLHGKSFDDSADVSLKIKNLYFEAIHDEYLPFYACSFDAPDSVPEILKFARMRDYGTYDGTESVAGRGFLPKYSKFSINGDDEWEYTADIKMLCQEKPDDWTGSDESGFLYSELRHGLLVKSPADFYEELLGQYIVLSFDRIDLPYVSYGSRADKINISCLVRKDPASVELQGDTASEFIPVYVKFNNDDAEYPLFTKSLINDQYTLASEKVVVPQGASSVSVRFKANPKVSYMVDNLVLSAELPGWHCCHLPCYDDLWIDDRDDGVPNVESYSTVKFHVDSSSDILSFEGVDRLDLVEIFTMAGMSVSCEVVDGSVDISRLVAGGYVVIVNNAISGKFIKK